MWALNVESVSKSYAHQAALRSVSLRLRVGEFVALLGPNGAGKSTLMQLLTGLFVADSGRIEVLGVDMRTHAPPALARVGVVFQQSALDLDLSVQANLSYHARLHGMAAGLAQSRITQCLADVGLSDSARTRVRALSAGNQRKVELARAMVHQPQLLLMDEATVGLDIASRQQLLQLVRRQQAQRQLSTLWITHLSEEARDADRVLVLHHGQVIADAAPSGLVQPGVDLNLEAAFLRLTAK